MRTGPSIVRRPRFGSHEASSELPDPRRRALVVGMPLAAGVAALPFGAGAASRQDFRAFGSWAASAVSAVPTTTNRISNQTVRQVVNVSLGGDAMRVKLSNRYGTTPLVVQAAAVALSNGNESILAATARPLTFSGRTSFTVPAFGEIFSDWLVFSLGSLTELAIDLFLPGDTSVGTSPLTLHTARPSNEIVAYLGAGNLAGATTFPTEATRAAWYFLTGVDVSSSRAPGAIVCFGDSITDGVGSTAYANARYPDYLARRIVYGNLIAPMGVVNQGISGNRVNSGATTNPAAMARFDRDVLTQSGASHVIVMEGINDISGGLLADRVIQGHRQLIERAHAKRLKIYGATLTPFGNAPDARENERQQVNRWIRTSGTYDAVIDFDLAVRNPANPRFMLSMYDSGDTLHPSSAGYAAMANAIDLSLFAGSKVRLS